MKPNKLILKSSWCKSPNDCAGIFFYLCLWPKESESEIGKIIYDFIYNPYPFHGSDTWHLTPDRYLKSCIIKKNAWEQKWLRIKFPFEPNPMSLQACKANSSHDSSLRWSTWVSHLHINSFSLHFGKFAPASKDQIAVKAWVARHVATAA